MGVTYHNWHCWFENLLKNLMILSSLGLPFRILYNFSSQESPPVAAALQFPRQPRSEDLYLELSVDGFLDLSLHICWLYFWARNRKRNIITICALRERKVFCSYPVATQSKFFFQKTSVSLVSPTDHPLDSIPKESHGKESRECLWLCGQVWGPTLPAGLPHPTLVEEGMSAFTAAW